MKNINYRFLLGLFVSTLIGCVSKAPSANFVEIDKANVENVEIFILS